MPDDAPPPASLATVDDGYEPIRPFEEWADGVPVPEERWQELGRRIEDAKSETTEETLLAARDNVSRVAAIETGAIEDLYDLDAGFTISVATQSAMAAQAILDATERPKRDLIQSQLAAYDYVIDLVSGEQPVSQSWIRQLHERMCAAQETHVVWVGESKESRPLPKGQYKSHPNHVFTQAGEWHSYAPVIDTPAEMEMLVDQLSLWEFQNAHPALQAAYAHHALTHIHPFADGNGRVARALASVFTYRALSAPALVLADQKGAYLRALRAADDGRPTEFVQVTRQGAEDAAEMFLDAVDAAKYPAPAAAARRLEALYVTSGGYTHQQVDVAARLLLEAAKDALDQELGEITSGPITAETSLAVVQFSEGTMRDGYRGPVGKRQATVLGLKLTSQAPANSSVLRDLRVEVPRDCERHSSLYLHGWKDGIELSYRAESLIPAISSQVLMRLRHSARRIIAEAVGELSTTAEIALRRSGY